MALEQTLHHRDVLVFIITSELDLLATWVFPLTHLVHCRFWIKVVYFHCLHVGLERVLVTGRCLEDAFGFGLSVHDVSSVLEEGTWLRSIGTGVRLTFGSLEECLMNTGIISLNWLFNPAWKLIKHICSLIFVWILLNRFFFNKSRSLVIWGLSRKVCVHGGTIGSLSHWPFEAWSLDLKGRCLLKDI